MSNRKMAVNAIFNVVRTSLSIIFPIITYPYAARVLGKDGLGMVSYGSSIVSYFTLAASLGTTNYATREGAKLREDKERSQHFFEEVFTINICCMIFSYIFLILLMILSDAMHGYTTILIILGTEIFFKTFSVDWVNTVYEDFTYITLRSIITHIVSLIILFTVVKKPDDVYIYAVMTVITYGINCLMNLIYCRKYIRLRIFPTLELRKHIVPLLYFFANDIAVSVYVNIDTTMLGYYKGDSIVGIYTIAVKIYSVIKKIFASIYAVTIPKLAELAGNSNETGFRNLYTQICSVLSILLIPAAIGLIALSEELVFFMGGSEYGDAALSLQILSVGLVFAIYGGLITVCFNVTHKRERINLYATFMSAIINVVLNFVIIPVSGHYGAAFTTTLSEGFVFIFCFMKIKDKTRFFDIRFVLREIINASVGAVLILIYSIMVHKALYIGWMSFVIILFGSIIIYFIWMIAARDKLILSLCRKVRYRI